MTFNKESEKFSGDTFVYALTRRKNVLLIPVINS